MLQHFAREVQGLRDARMPQKVGVMVPTYNRPDFVRAAVLQLAHQSRAPDVICVHQNGHPDSYRWAVADLKVAPQVAWLHTGEKLRQHEWYAIPLRWMIEHQCTHFFWTDHDDIYLHDHIERGLADLEKHDFSVSPRCGLLFTKSDDWRYNPEVNFTSHAPGGASSTMCFTRRFAVELLADITADHEHQYTDNVVAQVTMPKFNCAVSQRRTCIYHSHEGSLTSHEWLQKIFG